MILGRLFLGINYRHLISDSQLELRNSDMESLNRPDRANKLNQELLSLQAKVLDLPLDELGRDLAEVSIDLAFLEAQLSVDIGSYSPKELERANEKVSYLKQRAEILKIELSRRI